MYLGFLSFFFFFLQHNQEVALPDNNRCIFIQIISGHNESEIHRSDCWKFSVDQSESCRSISISQSRRPGFDPIWPVGDKESEWDGNECSEGGGGQNAVAGGERGAGGGVVWRCQNHTRMRGSNIKKPLRRTRASVMLITSNEVNIQLLQAALSPATPSLHS